MITAFRKLFEVAPRETPEQQAHRLQLAAAALLIETARADFREDEEEQQALQTLLCDTLHLAPDSVADLMQEASARLDEATSLYDFTRVINDHFSAEQKQELIRAMWRVAFADGRLDKYEEHLIRQVAELTYVPHTEFIRMKLEARG